MKNKKRFGGFKTQIWKVVSEDEIRPKLECAYFTNGYVYATDAHVMIRQKLSVIHDIPEEQIANLEGKYIHRSVLKQLENFNHVIFEREGIKAFIRVRESCIFKYSEIEGEPINYEAVIPKKEEQTEIEKIKLSVSLLKNLGKAMSNNYDSAFIFNFHGKEKGVIITTEDYDKTDELGLIMPKTIN